MVIGVVFFGVFFVYCCITSPPSSMKYGAHTSVIPRRYDMIFFINIFCDV